MRRRVSGAQLTCADESRLRGGPVPIDAKPHEAERRLHFRVRRVQTQRLLGRLTGLRHRPGRRLSVCGRAEERPAIGKAGIGQSVVTVLTDGLLEEANGLGETVKGAFREMIAANDTH